MRKLLMVLSICLCFGNLWAQNRTVIGKVTDEKGAPIPGASITLKGSTSGTSAGNDGSYSLSVPASVKHLVFSAVNFNTREVSVDGKNRLDVVLDSKVEKLDDVVVTGYQVQRKKDVTAAITRVAAADIDNLPMPNFAQALQGRAPGVIVAAANGVPGGSLSVIIRGVGSINAGTVPLYVVDGVQINTSTGSINTQNNPLNFLNTDDIESIEILKDAAAASIYGARAGNGVVLVTTKKGRAGKTRFNFNTFHGVSSALNTLPVLTTQEWFNVRYEALANANPTSSAASIRATVLSNLGLASTTTQGKIDSLPTYDWQKESFKTGKISQYELSMQGGSQNLSFYVSGSYQNIEHFIAPTNFNRASLLSRISYKINDKFTFENTISLSSSAQNAPYSLGNTGFGNPAYASAQILPINPIYNDDGSFYGLPSNPSQIMVGTFNHNVMAVGAYAKYKTRTNQLVGNASLTYKPTSELTFRTMVGLDYRLTQDRRYQDPRVNDAFAVSGRLSSQSDWNTNFITTTTGAYNTTINRDHSVNALLGVEYRRDVNEWFQADGQGFPSYMLEYLSAAATPVGVSGQWSGSATFSQFAKLGYSYQGKYIFNYTARRDGSSRFGANNKYGIFQSAQAAWNVKDELFMQDVKAISDLKLRFSFGQTGNDQIGNVLYSQLYGASRVYGNSSAINPTQLGNPDLSWETREESNLGLELGLFKNKVSLVIDAYRRVNKDLLLDRSLYATTGFTTIRQNLGSTENKGLEIGLTVNPFTGPFKWTSSFNIAFQSNKVLSLYDGLQALPNDASIRVGSPLGSFYTTEWAGVNPATGRGMWYDKDGNITYNPAAADRKIIGNIYPTHFGGWTNAFSYKGFTLEAFFQYEYGRLRSDGQYTQMMRMGGATVNTLKEGYDARWQKPGDITYVPRPFNGLADFNSVSWGTGTRYVNKTDYIRLKQVTLSYDLPAATAKKLSLESVRFYVQGINLWTYTKWLSYDPEFTGDNFGILPTAKNVTVGVQVKL